MKFPAMHKKTTFIIFCLLACHGGAAQNAAVDSLATVVAALPDDTAKVRKLFELADKYYGSDFNKEGQYLKSGYRLAQQLGAVDWMPQFETRIGANFANTGQPDTALHYFNLAQQGFASQGLQKELASVFSKKRWVYNYLGDFETALDHAFRALDVYEKIGDEPGVAIAYSYIGEILYSQQKYQEAADYFQKGYDLQKRLGLKDDLAYSCQGLGDAWLLVGDYEKALAYQNEGLKIRRELQSDIDIALSLNSRGNVLKYMERYPAAIADYKESLKIARQSGFDALAQSCISNMGHVYNLQKKYREALPYLLESQRILEATGELRETPESYSLIADAYNGIGRHDSAYHFQKLHSEIKDSLLTEETSARMSELQTKYETAQKEAKIAVQAEQLQTERTRFRAVVAVLAIALMAGALLFRLTRKLRQRNEEKEFLIKEIHHRVKNNLQVLSSLLYLQSKHIKDDAALDAVREGQNRVEAMSLIHQKLYMGDNLAAVEMQDYLKNLGETLVDSFGLDDRVTLKYEVQPLHLDVDTAIPLGLIITELVTNALKYAFPDDRSGTVEISLGKNKAGKLSLKVSDNGVGKDAAPSLENSTSFGSNLVEILSKKLKGKPQILDGEGYATLIEFEHFKEA